MNVAQTEELLILLRRITKLMETGPIPFAVPMANRRAETLSPERRREIAQKAIATRWAGKNQAAVALGQLGGKKGGLAKVKKGIGSLTPEERKAVSAKGVAARQAKKMEVPPEAANFLRKMGRVGGQAKVPKGFARMDPEKKAAALKKALATRRANAAAKKKAGGKGGG